MNRYLTLLLVGFLLFNQVLSRPNPEDKEQESDYPGDEEEESNDGDDDGPDVADIIIPSEVKMLSKDEDFKIKIGDDVRFPCRFTTGHAKADADDDVVYVWRRGKDQIALSDSLLISDSRFEIIEDHTLLLRNATVNDSSTSYVCELIASADFKPRVTHRLLVEPNELNYKVVPVPNSELHVNLHEPVKFGCKTDATSKTKITISHNGNKVHIQETDDGAYVNIKDVTRHHAGYYQCLVDFNAEKPITTAVHLIVNHPPEIELDQDHEITDKGPKVKLICKVHAQPHADVHWFKEDQKVESPDFIFGKEKPAKHTLTFDFDQDEKNFGKYSCQAINNLGSDKKDIVVSGKPSKPTFHHGEVVEDGKVLSLKWKTISFTELIKYEIQYRRKGDVQWQMLSIDKEVGNDVGHEYIIEGKINNLEADKYEAVCRAENKDGWSELSDVFEFKGEEKTERAENVIDPKNSSGRPVVFLSTILLTLTTLLFVITPFACL